MGAKGEGNVHLNADTGFSPGTEESFSIKMLMKEHTATPNPQPPPLHLPIGLYSIADQSLPSSSLPPTHLLSLRPSHPIVQPWELWAESERSVEGADHLLKANEIGDQWGWGGELELWNHQIDLSCVTFQLCDLRNYLTSLDLLQDG